MGSLTEADYEIQAQVFQERIGVFGLKAGDVLLCRPQSAMSQSQTEALHRQLDTLCRNKEIAIVIVPSTWDLAVARERTAQDIIDDLTQMIQDTS